MMRCGLRSMAGEGVRVWRWTGPSKRGGERHHLGDLKFSARAFEPSQRTLLGLRCLGYMLEPPQFCPE